MKTKSKFNIKGVKIEDIIPKLIKIEKVGKTLIGNCPFHKGKTNFFEIIPSQQKFFCHGCQKEGNLVDFIAEYKKLSIIKSIELIHELNRTK